MAFRRIFINIFRRRRLEHDIKRELAFHMAERADELEAQGLLRRDALRFAKLSFGNFTVQAERTRDMDIANWLDGMLRNLRLAARNMRKSPAFTLTVVLTLALGIGASSAVFSAIDAVLLRPLPFPDSDRLMVLRQVNNKDDNTSLSTVRLADWNRMNSTFQAMAGYYTQDESETSGDVPEHIKRALVTPGFLQVWGIAPLIGRDFVPDEAHFGGPNAVLISDRLWQQRFGGDLGVVGKTLRLGTYAYPIIGVMPRSFLFPDREVDVWSLSPVDAPYAQDRASTWFNVTGRLKPAVSVAEARADMESVQADLAKQYPKTDADLRVQVDPLKEETVGAVRGSLWLLFASVSLLLLIACTNIAALMLVRATQRRHEIAVRFSIGASRWAVGAQFLMESFLLALLGAGLGLLIATGASRVFRVLAADFPRVGEIKLDWTLVFYTLGCAVLSTFLCGLLPVLRATRHDVSAELNNSGRGQVSSGHRLPRVLVAVQVALAVTLLAGAGLLVRSLKALGQVSPGFEISNVLMFQITSTWGDTADFRNLKARTDRMLDGLRALPGVESATIASDAPGVPTKFQMAVTLADGRVDGEPDVIAEVRGVGSGYFNAMHIPVLEGEPCPENLNGAYACVNRRFVERYMQGQAAVGRHMKWASYPNSEPATICGIVGDAREEGINHEPVPTVYWCTEAAQPNSVFLIRTKTAPAIMAETVRQKMKEMEPMRSVFGVELLTDRLDTAFAENKLRAVLLAAFAATALSMACIGLYGMLTYVVSTRRREVGLRLALGAVRKQILTSFLLEGLGISLVGCLAGVGLSLAFARTLAGMLFGVSASDPVTIAVVVILMLLVAVAASLLPALRAAHVDPMQVLRDE